jgi:hypothetical protein
MKEIFSSTYRIGYLDGYSMGLNPHESPEGNIGYCI